MFDTESVSAPDHADRSRPGALLTGLRDRLGLAPVPVGRAVHADLRPLFPGGLQPGVHAFDGALSVGLGLLAGADWSAVVGLGDLGVEAAVEWGVATEKMITVPRPGADWWEVVAELVEIADVVLAAPPDRVSDASAQRLAARLRHRDAALVVAGDWPRSRSRIRADVEGWSGLGVGHGHLTAQRLLIEVTERHRTRRHRIVRRGS